MSISSSSYNQPPEDDLIFGVDDVLGNHCCVKHATNTGVTKIQVNVTRHWKRDEAHEEVRAGSCSFPAPTSEMNKAFHQKKQSIA